MRILHTSDWHLGRSFGDHRLLDQQARFIDWLVDVVRQDAIDLVVVAGDLFDRSVPPADAIELFHDALRRLAGAGADIAAITGNHDSAERLGSIDGLLAPGLLLRGGYRRAADVEIRSYGDGPLAIVAVPYLDPVFAPRDDQPGDGQRRDDEPGHDQPAHDRPGHDQPGHDQLAHDRRGHDEPGHDGSGGRRSPTHETVLAAALSRARGRIAGGVRSLAIAHAFVTGASPSDSERTLAVGEAAMVSSAVFAGFDYSALGHLHRAQPVAGDERIRYSGAPLPYSFGETSQKEIVLVELDRDGDARPKPVPIDVGRAVATVRGTLDQLLAGDPNTADWVRVELTDPHPVVDAHRRLRDHFPHLVEISRVERAVANRDELTVRAVRNRSRHELADQFLETVAGVDDTDDVALLRTAIDRAERDRR